jgi:methylenetetrahydrofolate reductase (NADPH)
MAEYMRDKVAGLTVPDHIIERLNRAENAEEEGQKIAIEQIHELREIPGVSGVHIMAIEAEKTVAALAEKAGLLPRPA